MSKYYVVLTGAQKNAGDYLITEKCKELLRRERPEHELVQLGRWESLDDKLDLINGADALILMGGPAVSPDFYPSIYKLTTNLDDIKVPIVPMAVGWNSKAGDFHGMMNFTFNNKSKELLRRFATNGVGISARDSYTASILRRNNIPNVYLTGCASWYTPEKFNTYIENPSIKKIAVTPAQHPRFSNISKQMIDLVEKIYPESEITLAFHRGIGEVDEFTKEDDAANTTDLAEYGAAKGMNSIDLAYSFDNYQKYDDIDLHIGFRLHAHLYFLSNRKPSILLNEDGRGRAMSETIGLTGIDTFKRTILKKPSTAANLVLNRVGTAKRYYPDVDYEAIEQLEHLLNTHKENDYRLMNGALKVFDENYAVMQEFIKALP